MTAMSLPDPPSFRLDGRRALVTGAGRGIGAAAAAALAGAGAEVTLVARTRPEIEAVASLLNAQGAAAQAVDLDVSDPAKVQGFFAERPAFHVLVNNAGTNRPKPVLDVSVEDYDAVLGLNLRAAFFVAQAAARAMVAEGVKGSLIHVSSQMGHVGGMHRTLYCASKWGLEGLSKALAIDLAPHGVRSNTIAPTFIETDMTRRYMNDASALAFVLSKIKLGRLGQVQDLLGPLLLLASDASSLMTGTSIVVDGGWTAD